LSCLEGADLKARREWTRSRLEEVLWSARRSSYGQRVRGTKDLQTWPLLAKEQVQAVPSAFCASSRMLTVKATTGGTSGAPLQLFRSLRSIVFEQAGLDWMASRLGIDARSARCAVLRTDSIKDPNDFRPPYWVRANGGRRLVFSSSHLNFATIGAYGDAMNAFKPDILMAYPSSLEALCLQLERSGRELRIPRVICSSEVLQPAVWQEAQRRLGCALLDYYGQAERVAFAYAVQQSEYRFLPGYAYVELHPMEEADDQRTYEIVGTPLWNPSMSLIRYRTGDLIRLPSAWGAAELEALTLGAKTFSGVLGRSGDILITPEGVKVTGISHFHRDVPNVMRIQVIQESPREVTILVLAAASYSSRDEARLMQNVRRKLPQSISVEIRRSDALERTARGKTPFVIHRPAVKELLKGAHVRQGSA
jgi:phenylacetate-CoA ligase